MPHTYVTADLPGTGGRLRHEPSDFLVEELPLYEPCGEGDHLYLRIEKRGVTTHDAVRRIASAVSVRPRDVGVAGMKDARAVAVQTLSVEHVADDVAERALTGLRGITLLGMARHRNKLRLGHLRGNRFTIRVRGVTEDARVRAGAILERLAARGSPNWFGAQRFGMRGDNDVVGRALVRRDAAAAVRAILGCAATQPEGAADVLDALDAGHDQHAPGASRADDARRLFAEGRHAEALEALPQGLRTESTLLRELARGRPAERALSSLPRHLLRLYVSAYQSRLFNRCVADRLATLAVLENGDLAYLHDRGAVFAVEDAAAEQPRADRFEISPSAPLIGTRLLLAGGVPGERERALVAQEGLRPEEFRVRGAGELRGERRPLRIPVSEADVRTVPLGDDGERSIAVHFALPRGCFATSVMGEILKTRETAPPLPATGDPQP